MPTATIKRALAEESNGERFEDFCKAFCSRKYGSAFRPVGGKKDGGRDGIFVRPDRTTRIYQFSIDGHPARKIAKTIRRLRESLDPDQFEKFKELHYFSNQIIKDTDRIEAAFERDNGKGLRIYDINWLYANLNSDDRTLNIAGEYYSPESEPIYESSINREVYAFFSLMTSGGDELIDRTLDLRSRAIDALVLQELRDTSSESRITRQELLSRLSENCPWAAEKIVNTSLRRLNEKHSKKEGVRLLNWHKKDDTLCLPFDTVCEVRDRRNEAIDLCDHVASKVKDFLRELPVKRTEQDRAWTIVQEYLAKVFSTRGSHILDWVDSKEYTLGPTDLGMLEETLAERGIRDKALFSCYQYILARLLESRSDLKIMAFLQRLNQSYLLHLMAGRDIKVHGILDNMRRALTLVCCSSVLMPQIADFIQTGKSSILASASLNGMRLKTTNAFLEEVRYQMRESLRFDKDPGSISNEFTALAIAHGKSVKELFAGIGLQMPNFGNIGTVMKELFGVEILPPIDSSSDDVKRLANALMPYRRQQFPRALADASAFFYIKERREQSRTYFQTWWLTRETATVKVAAGLGIIADERMYMRIGFLQEVLLVLPCRDDLDTPATNEWARDTLLLSTPTDSLPSELIEPYRKAKKEFEQSHSAVSRIKTLEKIHAFMALGAVNDKLDS